MIIKNEQLDMIFELSQKCLVAHEHYEEKYPNHSIKAGKEGLQSLRSPEYQEFLTASKSLKNFLETLEHESLLEVFALFEYGRELSHYKGIHGLLEISRGSVGETDEIFDDDLALIPKDSELYCAAVFLSDKSLLFPMRFINNSVANCKSDQREDIIRHLGNKGAVLYSCLKYAKEAIDYLNPWQQ